DLGALGALVGAPGVTGRGRLSVDGHLRLGRTAPRGRLSLALDRATIAHRGAKARLSGLAARADLRLPPRGSIPLEVSARRVELGALFDRVTGGQVRVRGRLAGRARLEIRPAREPWIRFASARLESRGRGRLWVRGAAELAGLRPGTSSVIPYGHDAAGLLRHRIAGALSDFEVRRLVVALRRDGGGPLRAVADLRGVGRRVPQELSLVVRLHGLGAVAGRALRLWRDLAAGRLAVRGGAVRRAGGRLPVEPPRGGGADRGRADPHGGGRPPPRGG
ncbi:MAG TPA: hypothetical protein VKZ63_09615, partial [Kofleriaceae bacterium]|nr:hypothetical protein [Kofleriaceae bacterium]